MSTVIFEPFKCFIERCTSKFTISTNNICGCIRPRRKFFNFSSTGKNSFNRDIFHLVSFSLHDQSIPIRVDCQPLFWRRRGNSNPMVLLPRSAFQADLTTLTALFSVLLVLLGGIEPARLWLRRPSPSQRQKDYFLVLVVRLELTVWYAALQEQCNRRYATLALVWCSFWIRTSPTNRMGEANRATLRTKEHYFCFQL